MAVGLSAGQAIGSQAVSQSQNGRGPERNGVVFSAERLVSEGRVLVLTTGLVLLSAAVRN